MHTLKGKKTPKKHTRFPPNMGVNIFFFPCYQYSNGFVYEFDSSGLSPTNLAQELIYSYVWPSSFLVLLLPYV